MAVGVAVGVAGGVGILIPLGLEAGDLPFRGDLIPGGVLRNLGLNVGRFIFGGERCLLHVFSRTLFRNAVSFGSRPPAKDNFSIPGILFIDLFSRPHQQSSLHSRRNRIRSPILRVHPRRHAVSGG